jgi:hypothetical protein
LLINFVAFPPTPSHHHFSFPPHPLPSIWLCWLSFPPYPFTSHPLHTDISPARTAYLSLHHLTAFDWLRLIYLLICVFIVLYSCLSCSD